jgi:hypothetical protein
MASNPATFTLTNEQLQSIIQSALAGAMATAASTARPATKRPDRPIVDLNCSESRCSPVAGSHFLAKPCNVC